MRILSFQSDKLEILDSITYPDISYCRHKNAVSCYKKLFEEYNEKFGTGYTNFFWGFSHINKNVNLTNKIIDNLKVMISACETDILYVIDIPNEIIVETDFYNFSDEIYSSNFPDELKSYWISIYDLHEDRERQAIFPYIKKEWIVKEIVYKDGDYIER